MLSDPRVSACMVLYRTGEEALSAVRCVQDATEPVTLFVVDNAPKDSVANRIAQQCRGAKILSMERNVGYGQGNNAVLPYLKSKYHLIMNPDVTFDPDLITRMADWMDAHEDAVILTPRVVNLDGSEQFLPKRRPTVRYLLGGRRALRGDQTAAKAEAAQLRADALAETAKAAWERHHSQHLGFADLMRCNRIEWRQSWYKLKAARLRAKAARQRRWRDEYTLADQPPTEPMEVSFATGCFLFIRTHPFYRLGGFDRRFFLYQEDSDLSLSALKFGKIVYHPDMVVTHAWHRDSAHDLRQTLLHVWSTIRFFNKWGWKW